MGNNTSLIKRALATGVVTVGAFLQGCAAPQPGDSNYLEYQRQVRQIEKDNDRLFRFYGRVITGGAARGFFSDKMSPQDDLRVRALSGGVVDYLDGEDLRNSKGDAVLNIYYNAPPDKEEGFLPHVTVIDVENQVFIPARGYEWKRPHNPKDIFVVPSDGKISPIEVAPKLNPYF
jgi:hypothetical protein